ncbi:MAG: hypothetical protein ACAI38_08110 [Myxococcota bacterium]
MAILVCVPHSVAADGSSNAAVLHARALLDEDDGDKAAALMRLRQAQREDPASELIAFDLARLALEGEHPATEDLQPLIDLPLRFEASRRLKVYALIAAGRGSDASRALDAARFDAEENAELRALLAQADTGKRLALDARFGVERDTNVTLLPDSEGARDAGTRLVLDTTLGWQPIDILEVGIVAQLARHLDDRDALEDYDYGIATAVASLGDTVGPVALNADVSGAIVTTSLMSNVFTTEAAARLDAQLDRVPLRPGVYARGGVRNYAAGNLEDVVFDRDAKLYGGGIVSDDRFGRWSYLARGGYVGELAQGAQQRQRGLEANAYGRGRFGDFELTAALAFTRRWYYDSTTGRRDTRLSPSIDLSYAFAQHFGAAVGYSFTHNGSTADNFRYARHIVRLTLTGSL